jgi:1-aminocyclopropane-1-carboxylate deaminase/D-cysteine desulfhydrase-like pyridoxal-dependent ACC family enzyme
VKPGTLDYVITAHKAAIRWFKRRRAEKHEKAKAASTALISTLNVTNRPGRRCQETRFASWSFPSGKPFNEPEELCFIAELAALEGVILDPVYTGKAFRGMVEEIKRGRWSKDERMLFIHTGGLYGVFPKNGEFGQANVWK